MENFCTPLLQYPSLLLSINLAQKKYKEENTANVTSKTYKVNCRNTIHALLKKIIKKCQSNWQNDTAFCVYLTESYNCTISSNEILILLRILFLDL